MLAVEEMLSISINGEAYTITMRSPGTEEDLVRGILLTEDVYRRHDPEPKFTVLNKNKRGDITEINVLIPSDLLGEGIKSKRNLMSVTSCGMCGKQEAQLELGPALENDTKISASSVEKMFEKMKSEQELFDKSGGSHAAAAFCVDGKLLTVREDIGRHNAVDKVIGCLLRNKTLDKAHSLLVSGRVSYEIVSKAYKACIPILAAVSAPSSMAAEVCQEVGITLLAFCRGEKFTVYSHEERLVP